MDGISSCERIAFAIEHNCVGWCLLQLPFEGFCLDDDDSILSTFFTKNINCSFAFDYSYVINVFRFYYLRQFIQAGVTAATIDSNEKTIVRNALSGK